MDKQKKGRGRAGPGSPSGTSQRGSRPPGDKRTSARPGTPPKGTSRPASAKTSKPSPSRAGDKRKTAKPSSVPPKPRDSRPPYSPPLRERGQAPSLEDRAKQARKMQSRQEARDQNGRRHRRRRKASTRFYSILVVLFAVAIGVTLCMTVFFNIQTIRVVGETRYETDEIIRASGLAQGKNLLLADTKGGEEDLTVKLPYIGEAKITRQLPATVIIEVEETTPTYAVQMAGGWAVADQNGKTLEYMEGQTPSLPVAVGISVTSAQPGQLMEFADEEQKNKLIDLTKALKENNLIDKTNQMDFTNGTDITVLYDNRITLKLGGAVDLEDKLTMAREAINRKASDGQEATIVLTSSQATVRFQDSSSEVSSQSSSAPEEESSSSVAEESSQSEQQSALSSVD